MIQTDSGLVDDVTRALSAGYALQDAIAAGETPNVKYAKTVLADAHRAGELAWAYKDRDQLNLILRRTSKLLRRSGVKFPPAQARLKPFKGQPPIFKQISYEELVETVKGDRPVVGRRLTGPAPGAAKPHTDFTGALIYDCAFTDCNFDGVDFTGATLTHTSFERCSFKAANFSRTAASTCLFAGDESSRADFSVRGLRANFSASHFVSMDLSGARLRKAAFSYGLLVDLLADSTTDMAEATFDLALLNGIIAPGVMLKGGVFVGASLVNVDFTGADLRDAVFSSARVAGVRFASAKLHGAHMRSAYYLGLADFDKADVKGADLTDEDRKAIERETAEHEQTAPNPG
jgi:uncharacterized protein YjbI with pentapeptide repeats